MTSLDPRRADRSVEPVVFGVSAALIVAFVAIGVRWPSRAARLFAGALDVAVRQFGWLYVVAVGCFVSFALLLGLSRHGRVRLGPDDARPEFSRTSWFAMLFSAGMGIGLLFYGVAEPVMHFAHPPAGESGTPQAAVNALAITFFHWGFHAWSIYIVMAAALGYFAFRRGLPLAIRSALQPLLGARAAGPLGHAVDILAVFGTLFGLATSLGLGAMQINAGLAEVFGVSVDRQVQVLIIVCITLVATASVVSGLGRGVRRLSELNLVLVTALLLFILFAGPTRFLLQAFWENVGHYLTTALPMTFRLDTWDGDLKWRSQWTLFYWGWWIAWAPFVGMFVARISYGRTLRELVLGGLLVPTLVTCVWLTVLGDTALHQELHGEGGIAAAVGADVATAVYVMLDGLPWATLSSVLTIVVIATFFVTSSDSGSLVVDMLTSGGHPDPPVKQRVFWALSEGAVAAVLLVFGGLEALRSAAIITGLPFSVVLLVMCVGLWRALRREHREGLQPSTSQPAHRAHRDGEPAQTSAPARGGPE